MKEINDLPNEILLKILGYLSIKELVKNCRLVSKRFKFWTDAIKPKELILISNYPIKMAMKRWFITGESINVDDVIVKYNFNAISEIPFDLKQLRKFKLCLEHANEISFVHTIVNQLMSLEHFEIFFIKAYESLTLKLNSSTIKILYVDFVSNRSINIDNGPHLITLGLSAPNWWEIKLSNPNSVINLYVEDWGNYDELSEFKNMEVLHTDDYYIIKYDDIKDMPKLRELWIEHGDQHDFDYEYIESSMNSLLSDIKRIHSKINIYYDGQLLDYNKKFEDYGFEEKLRELR